MNNLTDYIEDYLKKLLALNPGGPVEIQRIDLARKFDCVPSQINYVLKCRFSLERGYLVESKRGGGGWIRLYRLEPGQLEAFSELFGQLACGKGPCPAGLRHFLKRLGDEKLISRREQRILEVLAGNEPYANLGLSEALREQLQKRLLLKALEELLKERY